MLGCKCATLLNVQCPIYRNTHPSLCAMCIERYKLVYGNLLKCQPNFEHFVFLLWFVYIRSTCTSDILSMLNMLIGNFVLVRAYFQKQKKKFLRKHGHSIKTKTEKYLHFPAFPNKEFILNSP